MKRKEEIILEECVLNIIKECITHEGYIEAGHLKYMIDTKLPIYFDNIEFFPCKIDECTLTVKYRFRFGEYYFHKCFNIEWMIEQILERTV